MLRRLPLPLACAVTFMVMLVALLFWVVPLIFPGILVKLLMPTKASRRAVTRFLIWCGQSWSRSNAVIYRALLPVRWRIELPPELDPQRSYLVICNHQSWADILVLFDVLIDRTPWPRFFMKKELIWVPIVGQCCWGMDFPFMKRHSQEAIARNPKLAQEDLETTRRACEHYRGSPIAIVNFLDGTRFTEAKRIAKKSPYRHLLRPKSAGMSFTLNCMGDQFAGLLDLTICYGPSRHTPLWGFLGGRQPDIVIKGRLRPIEPEWLTGDYRGDEAFRERFQSQMNAVWAEKDELLERMKAERGEAAGCNKA